MTHFDTVGFKLSNQSWAYKCPYHKILGVRIMGQLNP